MKRNWKGVIAGLLMAVTASLCAAQSLPYPSKPVRIVVGFPPGGGSDILARLVAQKLSDAFKQPFVIENRPGASTMIAADLVAKSPPDGYTLLVGSSSTMTVNPVLYSKMPYSATRDFQPITILGSFPLLLVTNPAVQAKSVQDLVEISKRKGNSLNYSSASASFQLSFEMFKEMSGANLYHIPYKGSSQALMALVSGDVQASIIDVAPLIPYIKSGKINALAVTSAKRSPLYPNLPTIAEAGMPGYEFSLWMALFAPAGTPAEIVTKIQKEVAQMMQTAEIRDRFASMGIETGGDAPEQVTAMIQAERERLTPIIKRAGLKAE